MLKAIGLMMGAIEEASERLAKERQHHLIWLLWTLIILGVVGAVAGIIGFIVLVVILGGKT